MQLFDRIRETTTTTGSGSFTLLGAPTGYQTFSSQVSVGDPVYYACVGGAQWEVGWGLMQAGNVLTRSVVTASSSFNIKVNFLPGTKDIFCTLPAAAIRTKNEDLQVFYQDFQYFVPTWATFVKVICVAGGGGGASGGASANTAYGGAGGGGAGQVTSRTFSKYELGQQVDLFVGLGGDGGAQTTFTAAGSNGGVVSNPGGNGGDSTFGTFLKSKGGLGGVVNTSNSVSQGGGLGGANALVFGYSVPDEYGGNGAHGCATDNAPPVQTVTNTATVSAGGGAGGGVPLTTSTFFAASAGGSVGTIAGGAAGTAGAPNGVDGIGAVHAGSGGGGGGGVYSGTGNATGGTGGAGGFPGGGGGGGGGGRTTTTAGRVSIGGAGGKGGDGVIWVFAYT